MRLPALPLVCLLLVLPSAVALPPPIPPVNDPATVIIAQPVPGEVPVVVAPSGCTVTTAVNHAQVACGPVLPPTPFPVLPPACLWTAVTVTSFVDAVAGSAVCATGGAAYAAVVATAGGPATGHDVDMTTGTLPWTCTADFASGAIGTVVCERGVDP